MFFEKVQAGLAEVEHRGFLIRGQSAFDVDEGLVRTQIGAQPPGIELREDLHQPVNGAVEVDDFRRNSVGRLAIDVVGENAAIAVGELTAAEFLRAGIELSGDGGYRLAALGQHRQMDNLPADDGEQAQKPQAQQPQTPESDRAAQPMCALCVTAAGLAPAQHALRVGGQIGIENVARGIRGVGCHDRCVTPIHRGGRTG